MKKIILIVLLTFLFCGTVLAQGLIETALKDPIGVRALGMGGAFTAVADDASAVFYNPAGLADLGFAYYSGNLDPNQEYLELNTYTLLNIGSVAYCNRKMRSVGGSVDENIFGYGARGPYGFSWGISYKTLLDDSLAGDNHAWSSDLGVIFRLTPEITLGALAQDYSEYEKINDVPSTARVGIAYRPFGRLMTIALDGRSGMEKGTLTNYGAEVNFTDGFALRVGSDTGNFTAGLTLCIPLFIIDYAYVVDPILNDKVQRFGVSIAFYNKKERPFSLFKPKEYALIDIRGNVVGGNDRYSIFGGFNEGADSIISRIKRAGKDRSIDGVMLRIGGFDAGLGSMAIVQEIRGELKKIKKQGKKVIAYIETSALGDEYYLASVADKIVAPKGADIGGLGKSIAVTKVKGLMDKIGVDMQIIAKGKYKTTFNSYGDKMTPEQRKMIESIVFELHREMLTDIADSRKIDIKKLKEIGDGSIFDAEKALELGLIDKLGYFKDATELANEVFVKEGEAKMVDQEILAREWDGDTFGSALSKIALIEVEGDIVTGDSEDNIIFGGRTTGSDTISGQIRKAADDMWVKAIVVRVNSGGGSAIASAQIYDEILYAKEKGKTVVASMGDVAASGGYYISCGADKIIADPSSITGSIGVFSAIPAYEGLYNKLGITAEVVKDGEHADMFSGIRKLSPEERKSLEELVTKQYKEFVSVVADSRKLSTIEADAVAQGKIFTGRQAKEVKLVDEIGGLYDAIETAKDLSKTGGEPTIVFYQRRNYPMMNENLFGLMWGNLRGLFTKKSNFEISEYKLQY